MERKVVILPQIEKILKEMGEQIRFARLRRRISQDLAAERAGVSRTTIWHIEHGDPSVSMGAYAAVLHALNGLDRDLLLIAKDDNLGRMLQDIDLVTPKRIRNKQ